MTVGILGLGLIGGSLARAYAKAGYQVLACEKDLDMLIFAQLAGAVHGELNDSNIRECDLILLAIYPDASAAWLEKNAHLLSKTALVMDCCGTKEQICIAILSTLPLEIENITTINATTNIIVMGITDVLISSSLDAVDPTAPNKNA
jgi:prephenate dehydrogenase